MIKSINQISQRSIAQISNYSLGKVNQLVNQLKREEYITSDSGLTSKGKKYVNSHHPQQATILAAGYGLR
ncbi:MULTISPECIES: winged helix-turn-helix domain-containing protein [Lactobacillus]|uniref:Winged helix-turn-helix domain-containing protein n=1 Tax=Lactobacillus xujianguonis TaxID=2495899 RepID=A0A437SVJ6_9LACO|nr:MULTISPECIES: winged helix-turn-helix domain-containing protein [Lactobacillus]RVU70943.1 winged helix-turn-helix domain-containing protein [Lactobacillus xujianguonis]RVU73575.1 winged helix-turn-helix domain-containing protein [Lactobacillus xujianguonis]